MYHFFNYAIIILHIWINLQRNILYITDKINYDYKVRAIGTNISLDRFYSNIDPVSVIKDLIDISDPNKNEKTIFVWPEGILPDISQKELVEYKWLFEKSFNENHLLVILELTAQVLENGNINYFNSFSIYDHNLSLLHSYNKVNLVPFGEFLPFENILKFIGLRVITNNYQSFSSGNKREIIEINKENFSLKILPLICYEIIYSGKIFRNPNFDLIINISEDGWFGKSIGPKQHFIHSVFRAVESGKYILRSTNNGISSYYKSIGHCGTKS